VIAILGLTALYALQVGPRERTLVLANGRFWTADSAVPWVEAVAIRGEWIVAAGSREEVMRRVGEEKEVVVEDLQGRFVVPGFIDTHTHFNRAGELLLGVNLLDVADDEGFRRRVSEAHARLPPGSWMVGGDWGAYDLGSQWVPSRRLLDSLVGERPALLNKWDRSVYVASAAALRAAGLDPSTHSGRLSGSELERVRAAFPGPSFEQRVVEARLALADLARHGVTTIHDNTPPEAMRLFQYLKERDSLSVRVCARPTLDRVGELAALGIETGFGDQWLKICGLKGFVDGIMGNSTARFREPYRHRPESRGQWRAMMEPPGNMERLLRSADSTGLMPQVHAIGDLAVDTLLDLFEQVVEERPLPRRARRFRIIHAQVVEPDDFARFGALGIVAEVQPYHAIDDMRWMEERIGERARWAYAFRSLKRNGAILIFGSDWPGTNASWYPADPILGIYAAVTRQTLEGKPAGGWFPQERLSVQEALEAYTKDAAWAAYEESWKGRILPGFVADLAVLSENLFEIPPWRIKDVRVELTMVGGRWVYRAEP
jgi:predicted amidohydrolase YtcJ